MQIESISSTSSIQNVSNKNIENSMPISKKTNLDMNNIGIQHQREKRYTEDEIINAIESANEKFIAYDRRFEFSIHEKTKEIMVKIIDVNTDEVIREIPPEKILDMVAAMWEIAGIIVDERV
jgi:flagellar protein FlaG